MRPAVTFIRKNLALTIALIAMASPWASAFANCTTETTDEVVGTALTASGEGSAGWVSYGSTQYMKNNDYTPNCRYIANASSTVLALYVPARSQSEWTSFLTNLPGNIAVSECSYVTYENCTSGTTDSGGGGSYSDTYSGSGPGSDLSDSSGSSASEGGWGSSW